MENWVGKLSGPNGGRIYLGGSVHGLQSTDYPLPSAYNRAFDGSSALVIEDDVNVSKKTAEKFYRIWICTPKGIALRIMSILGPMIMCGASLPSCMCRRAEVAKCKPWCLIMMLWSGGRMNLGSRVF